MSSRLAGRVVLVTGAARGIGRAVALECAAEGALVWACDVIEGELASVAAEAGPSVRARRVDVSLASEVEAFVAEALAAEGRIDALLNVAGIIARRGVEATDEALWDRILDVNLKGSFLMARAVFPAMRNARRGSIVSTSSNAGIRGSAGEIAYSASKFGLEGMSRALAKEAAGFGIAVNTITPGTPIHTPMSETTYTAEARSVWRDPREIAPAYVHLALQGPDGIHDRYVNAWSLVQLLRSGALAA